MNSFEEASLYILDLTNSYMIPNYFESKNQFDESINIYNNSNITTTITDEDAWNILKMEENLDWIMSHDQQTSNVPSYNTLVPEIVKASIPDTSPPSPIFSDSEIESIHESSSEFHSESKPEPIFDIDFIASRISNLPQKSRLNSTTTDADSETESSSEGSTSDSSSNEEVEWVPTKSNMPKKNRHNSSKQIRKRKPNVSHWLWELLQTPKNRKMIQFTDEKMGEFRIMDQKTLANLWGTRNGRINARMNYKDLARTMRYHYKKSKGQELQAVNRHLVYKFSRHFINARRNENVQ